MSGLRLVCGNCDVDMNIESSRKGFISGASYKTYKCLKCGHMVVAIEGGDWRSYP